MVLFDVLAHTHAMMKRSFGRVDGADIDLYTLSSSDGGIKVSVITLGATITSIYAPDVNGQLGEVTLGFDDAMPYFDGTSPYFGCVAGRYANRIALGKFTLDGKEFSELATNNGPNHLHGGIKGFDKRVWTAFNVSSTSISLKLTSADGEEGYPGELEAVVTYSLPTPDSLQISYTAHTSAATVCNLTNHTYYNLKDGGASPVTEHEIEIAADFYTPVDGTSIPLGEIKALESVPPMDLRKPVPIGTGLARADNGMGYDHNYCLRGPCGADGLQPVARVWEASSGRWMTVRSDQPGVQFYTGNYLDGIAGRGGTVYKQNHGFCLETQKFPDSPNRPHFPSATLRPGERYSHTTVHVFGNSASRPMGTW